MTTTTQTARAAAYLVAGEVRNARDASRLISTGEPFTHLPTDAWRQTRLLLSEVLEFSSWTQIAEVYKAIHGYNWRVSAGILGDDPDLKDRVCGAVDASALAADEVLSTLLREYES